MKGLTRIVFTQVAVWSGLPLCLMVGLVGGNPFVMAQEDLPPIPIPSAPSGDVAPAPMPPSGDATPPQTAAPISPASSSAALPPAEDLRQTVDLYVVESLAANESNLPSFQQLQQELAQQSSIPGQPPIQKEYNYIRSFLARYGTTGDRLLEPAEFNQLLNRPRPPVPSQQLSPGIIYFALPELTPAVASQIRQILYRQDYSNGIVLDLRGSVGYDPRVVADIARLFLPRNISPLVFSTNRVGERSLWDGNTQPIATGIPLVVFVDGQTQRGATLLAATLDNGSNTIIAGQPTQGAGVQTQFYVLPSDASVEMAIARWQPVPLIEGTSKNVEQGIIPERSLSPGDDWLARVPSLLPSNLAERRPPTISLEEGRVGRFSLGMNLGNPGTGNLGIVDSVTNRSGNNVIRPNSDLKLYYLEDFVVFGYRDRDSLRNYFADRVYMNAPETMTVEGIGVGSTYSEVVATYGPPGENGYNEVNPFPVDSRINREKNYYFINYDALGIGFAFQAGTNQVQAIGLYKSGS